MQSETPMQTSSALYENLHRAELQPVIVARPTYSQEFNRCREIPTHYHEYIEIIYGLKGSFSVNLPNRTFEINEGDMLLINANEAHAFHHNLPCEYYCLQFDPSIVFSSPLFMTGAKYILPFISSNASKKNSFSLFVDKEKLKQTDLPLLIEDAYKEYQEKKIGYQMALRSDVYRIFLWYLRNMEKEGITLCKTDNIREEDILRLKSALDYIQVNYMHPVQVENMAKICNMSYSYFSRFFRHCMGQTFSDYLLYVRLMEAEKLLITTSRSISQIALDTGFSTSSYFITQFKKHRHITPKQLKQQLAKNASNEL